MPADKDSPLVITDKSAYILEEDRQLSDTHFFEEVKVNLTGEIIHRINCHVHNMLEKGKKSLKILVNIWPHWQDPTVLHVT